MRTVHLVIHGQVQGVWYRAWTVETATKMELTGWVRNRTGGTVEALVSGDADQVAAMIEACHRGPRLARVAHIDISERDGARRYPDFTARPTE